MQTRLNAYLSFKDEARQAMEFYKTVFGGKLDINTFGESGMAQDPSQNDLVMHAMLEADNGISFMASDTPPGMEHASGSNISMSLSGDDEAQIREYYAKLSAGGTITLPLEKAPWGDTFGMVNDKFGVAWMFNISEKTAEQ